MEHKREPSPILRVGDVIVNRDDHDRGMATFYWKVATILNREYQFVFHNANLGLNPNWTRSTSHDVETMDLSINRGIVVVVPDPTLDGLDRILEKL